jgi:hypothetical protein
MACCRWAPLRLGLRIVYTGCMSLCAVQGGEDMPDMNVGISEGMGGGYGVQASIYFRK